MSYTIKRVIALHLMDELSQVRLHGLNEVYLSHAKVLTEALRDIAISEPLETTDEVIERIMNEAQQA